uniref:Uncharacterized protein n=1 Tax=Arundo donax TaxID=35708 RepID=A0A0A9DKL8_ARUDO
MRTPTTSPECLFVRKTTRKGDEPDSICFVRYPPTKRVFLCPVGPTIHRPSPCSDAMAGVLHYRPHKELLDPKQHHQQSLLLSV